MSESLSSAEVAWKEEPLMLTLWEKSPGPALLLNRWNCVLDINPALRERLKADYEPLIGKPLDKWFGRDPANEWFYWLRNNPGTPGPPVSFPGDSVQFTPVETWVTAEVKLVRGYLTEPQLDIDTTIRLLQDTIQEMSKVISHDLRAPLRHLVQASQYIVESLKRGKVDGLGEYAEMLSEGSVRLDQYISGFVTYSRASVMELHIETVDLTRLWDDLLAGYTLLLEDLGADIQQDSLPTVATCYQAVFEILKELLENALRHIPEGRPPKLGLQVRERAGELQLHISDNGVGMPADKLEEAFVLFKKVHSEKIGFPNQGASIGLAYAKRLAIRLGGNLQLQANPDQGLTVILSLPR